MSSESHTTTPKHHEYGLQGINKKRFFKNNLHHHQNMALQGSRVCGDNRDDQYWSEYRRNYEISLRKRYPSAGAAAESGEMPAGPQSGVPASVQK
jgi:hypothetical protein